ncbi:CD225/dispanin family protein [Lysobacter hankyongensis]|uniref:CD225/dispanin family protein n=1 Tax=Lysobacter hankyongensis TaxID=1176535 RepID=A0ABP9BL59_9GAMM
MNIPEQPGIAKPVNNYLVWSIISLVITVITCCMCYTLPALATAIVATVFSTKVNGALNAGNLEGAQQASKNAKLWNQITAGLFLAGLALWIAMFFVQGGLAGQQEAMEQIRRALEQR